jgi:hypothetical protein
MILDKIYCSKHQDAFTLHWHENQFVITGDDVYIQEPQQVRTFLQSIEHKPNYKLFEKIDIDAYLKSLLSLRKVETK